MWSMVQKILFIFGDKDGKYLLCNRRVRFSKSAKSFQTCFVIINSHDLEYKSGDLNKTHLEKSNLDGDCTENLWSKEGKSRIGCFQI